ncbi:MAG: putative quinol monooxygenase [Lentilitoribacter sp.]
MTLTIVAKLTAVAGQEEFLAKQLSTLVAPTRAEKGCIQYDLHQSNEDPAVFLFFELWETRELWQDHMNSAHIKANGIATNGKIDNVELHEMSQIA